MNDEIELVAEIRPDVDPYAPEARTAARARLGVMRRKPYRLVLAGALAVGVAATAVAVMNGPAREAVPVALATPEMAKMSAEELLGRAAGQAAGDDLRPRADQYIEVSSQVMYSATAVSSGGTSRYLYRNNRTIWQSADGSRAGVLQSERLEPKAYPGWPVPDYAWDNIGEVSLMKLTHCDTVAPLWARYDYFSLSTWPDDVAGMRALLYDEGRNGSGPDQAAWTAVGDVLRENYVPPAQRAALFKAAATIPGVTVTENAQDAAGRHGLGAGREFRGIREEIIFDATTYELLGERQVVVDADQAQAPVGSLLGSTAQLEVKITDTVPAVADDPGAVCPEPAPSPDPANDSSASPETSPYGTPPKPSGTS
ncbi:CU044_5270 family protein [Acrocarpospora sp. B8E8]|uniref:CU044_5270 family protein n=1 Tax=Acrocarpospora sp. B8E8 TaxID=3153572 RepID=UPI00325E0460